MEITDGRVASFHYTLTDDAGVVIDRSAPDAPLSYQHGAGNIVPGLEKALAGRAAGDAVKAEVAPEEGYGPRHDGLVQQVPKSAFPDIDAVAPGMQFEAQTAQGPMVVTVTAIGDDTVIVDGNHPLAGVALHFDVTIAAVRDATDEERNDGHVAAG